MKNEARSSSRLLLGIPEVAAALSIGRTKVSELISTGSLPSVRIGRCVRISATTLERRVEEHETRGEQAVVHPAAPLQQRGSDKETTP